MANRSGRTISIGLVQHACDEAAAENLKAIEAGIRAAAGEGAQLLLLQELHNSPYFCQCEEEGNFDLAEPIPGPTTARLGELAKELGLVIVASLFERRAAGLYHNTAAVLERDGTLAGIYRKMHIPDDPGYYEKYYFTPGDLGFTPIDSSLGRLGVLVCWDQWYPEAARLMALAGAELLLYPTAIGWHPHESDAECARHRDAWVNIQRSHAMANGLPVVACNRVGFEPDPSGQTAGIRFWGHSFICGAEGELIASAGQEAEVLVTQLDLAHTEQARRTWLFLRDRRIDAYQGLCQRYID
jgi:N-carbamoylputrescine amidase